MTLLALLTFATVALAVSTSAPLREIQRLDGETTGRYMVTMKEGGDMHKAMDLMQSNVVQHWDSINGFAVEGSEEDVNTLLSHPDVATVEEDGFAQASFHESGEITIERRESTTQATAPWGIARVCADAPLENGNWSLLNHEYIYDSSAGQGVDIYVLDTGVYIEHNEFEGRARWGATFGGFDDTDTGGSGTYVAGIAASRLYGMAKKAEIVSVRVLNDYGSGTYIDILTGIDWVLKNVAQTGKPSIVFMGFRGAASYTIDKGVEALYNAGIHVTVASGNRDGNGKADNLSPARSPHAITVSGIDIYDSWDYYSNLGRVIDIFAPAEHIYSTVRANPDAAGRGSGSSPAAAHVAGMIATFISSEGNISPAAMKSKVQARAQKGFISNISDEEYDSVPNLLAHSVA